MCIIISLLLHPPVPVVMGADVQGGPRKGAERNAPSHCTDDAHAAHKKKKCMAAAQCWLSSSAASCLNSGLYDTQLETGA